MLCVDSEIPLLLSSLYLPHCDVLAVTGLAECPHVDIRLSLLRTRSTFWVWALMWDRNLLGSLAGAAHLLNDNAGVLMRSQYRHKRCVDQRCVRRGDNFWEFWEFGKFSWNRQLRRRWAQRLCQSIASDAETMSCCCTQINCAVIYSTLAWLNPWSKHMTAGRINQIRCVKPMEYQQQSNLITRDCLGNA